MRPSTKSLFKHREIKVLQVNLGYRCNMGCGHCHLSAGQGRPESMSRTTVRNVLEVLRENPVDTLDVTGGAPELNPAFRDLVAGARSLGEKSDHPDEPDSFFRAGHEGPAGFLQGAERGIDRLAALLS